MKADYLKTGLNDIDEALGGGIRRGSVVLVGSNTIRHSCTLSLSYISQGLGNGEISLYVNLRSVPMKMAISSTRGMDLFRAIHESNEPVFLDISSTKEIPLIGDLVETTGISRLVLSHPESLLYRDPENESFTALEDLFGICRDLNTGVIMETLLDDYTPYLLLSDASIEINNPSGGMIDVEVQGYPHPGGSERVSLEEGFFWGM